MIHTTARSLFLFGLILVVTGIGVGQVATGTPPFGSFGGGPFDTVDLGNLNVHFAIPLVHKAGRGTPFNYDLSNDSSVWYPVGSSGNQNWQPVFNWGWRAQTEMTAGYVTYTATAAQCLISGHYFPVTDYHNWAYHDPWGVVHPFSMVVLKSTCIGITSATLPTKDGSGYTMTATGAPSATVFPPSGGSLTPPLQTGSGAATVTDANGNQISVSTTGAFTDTLGTPVLTVSGTGTPSSPTVFTYTGPNGSVPVTMHYTYQTVRTYFRCSGITDYGPIANTPLVADVTLNDGSQYLFQYEQSNDPSNPGSVTGRVSQVTLPTGGIIQYQYSGGTNGINCVDGSAATMTRTLTPGGPWAYVHSQVSGSEWKTTVTTPPDLQNLNSVGDDIVLYFQGIYETQRLAYQGSASGTPLQTVVTCYNNNLSNCNTTAVTQPITRRTVTLQLPGGKQSKRDTFYDTTGYGLTTEVDEYDFNPTAPPLIRKTSTSYGSFNSSNGTCVVLNNGIVDHPCVVKVTDSGGNTKAQTTYTYDGATPASSGTTPQHISITGSRGNLTTLTMSASSSSATSISKTFTYYDTGTPNVATDVNGAQTTYVYGTAAQGNSTVSCGNSFPTTINEPLSLSRSIVWDCTGGVATKVTDENRNNVISNYTDPNFWRPANVYDQGNNETTITYIGQTAVEAALVNFNGGKSVSDSRTTVDGFGRPILSQTLQGPTSTNYDTAETDYNNLGQPSRTTMLFSAAGGSTSSTAPGAIITHDALGRVLTVTDGDTGTVSYTYTDNDVLQKVSGTQTFQKQFEYDGLGRLTSVCEISSTLPNIGTCGQATQQQGYWTKYGYDALGHLLTVTQNAQAATTNQQTRSLTYDWLGRMTSETNPETGNGAAGTVTYSYDPYSFCWGASADGNLHTNRQRRKRDMLPL